MLHGVVILLVKLFVSWNQKLLHGVRFLVRIFLLVKLFVSWNQKLLHGVRFLV